MLTTPSASGLHCDIQLGLPIVRQHDIKQHAGAGSLGLAQDGVTSLTLSQTVASDVVGSDATASTMMHLTVSASPDHTMAKSTRWDSGAISIGNLGSEEAAALWPLSTNQYGSYL